MSARPLEDPATRRWQVETGVLGMWVFLATEVLFFGALFLGYTHSRLADPQGFAAASRLTHLGIGTANTAILLTSSLTMALAVRAAALDERASRLLAATGALGVLFLVLKLVEYTLEWRDGLVPGLRFTYAGPESRAVARFFFLYFVMTAVHFVHLAIGLGAVAWIAARPASLPIDARKHRAIEVLGLYWHLVDAIWIFLYPMIYLIERWR
jgi:cytochrome c oxidase subunit 3